MTTNFIGASDEMNALLKEAFDTAAVAQFGAGTYRIFYQGVIDKTPPAPDEVYGQVWAQQWLGKSVGPGARRQNRKGFIFLRVHAPISKVGSWRAAQAVANFVQNRLARQSTPGTVWFREPTVNELPQDQTHHRLNVVAAYEYDEFV